MAMRRPWKVGDVGYRMWSGNFYAYEVALVVDLPAGKQHLWLREPPDPERPRKRRPRFWVRNPEDYHRTPRECVRASIARGLMYLDMLRRDRIIERDRIARLRRMCFTGRGFPVTPRGREPKR